MVWGDMKIIRVGPQLNPPPPSLSLTSGLPAPHPRPRILLALTANLKSHRTRTLAAALCPPPQTGPTNPSDENGNFLPPGQALDGKTTYLIDCDKPLHAGPADQTECTKEFCVL